MATADFICPKTEVLELYRQQKEQFHFHQRSDDDFIIFLLDTASRVLSIGEYNIVISLHCFCDKIIQITQEW